MIYLPINLVWKKPRLKKNKILEDQISYRWKRKKKWNFKLFKQNLRKKKRKYRWKYIKWQQFKKTWNSKKKFKTIKNFKFSTSKKLKFKKLLWLKKKFFFFKKFWLFSMGPLKNKKFKKLKKSNVISNSLIKNRFFLQKSKLIKQNIYFNFIFKLKLDVVVSVYFGITLKLAKSWIQSKLILVNFKITQDIHKILKLGDFVQIEPNSYLNLLKLKFKFKDKHRIYNSRSILTNTYLLGVLINQPTTFISQVFEKIRQKKVKKIDFWQVRLTKYQKNMLAFKNLRLFFNSKL